jgi:glutamyl-tRNA reductase
MPRLRDPESPTSSANVTALVNIGVVGISFKTAPISVRERLAASLRIEKIEELKDRYPGFEHAELVLLSTCNRIEIYYFLNANSSMLSESLQSLFRTSEIQETFQIYHHVGINAIDHLFEVAAGLDSLVLGEAQILSQVKESVKRSQDKGLSGSITSKLFSKAYENGRNLREENPEFAHGLNKSVSHAVLELIAKRFPLRKPNILLVGSGKMIRLAAGAIDKTRTGIVVVASRKRELDGIKADLTVQLSDIGRAIKEQEIDVVITATSSNSYILEPKDLHESISNNSEILILDISVPRNVDPRAATFPSVTLLNIDDLKDHIGSIEPEDEKIVSRIRESVSHKADEFAFWMIQYVEMFPLMAALRKKTEAIRSEEVRNALSRAPDLTNEQKAVIEKMSERIVRRFLHEPDSRLRQLTRENQISKARQYTEAIRELFATEVIDERDNQAVSIESSVANNGT